MLAKIRLFLKKYPDTSAVIVISLLFVILTAVIMIINGSGIIWGADTDWKNQHFAIPEYFRMRFYETHDPFPDFAIQIGCGQNIYNYSYYGIANPLYLPAYILPFIKMSTYIQFISLITVLVSAVMGYFFFKGHFRPKIALILAVMFLCSGGLFYHSHHHIMFMNYFPFLMGMLLGCRCRKTPLNILIMGAMSYCIMCTSFYFSVGCFAAAVIYMIYLELEPETHFSIVKFIKRNFTKVIGAVLGCLCSAFMWMPTLMAIISGREKTSVRLTVGNLLIPCVNLTTLIYSGYSMGLTLFALFSAVYMLIKGGKQPRFLAVILLCCTVFPFINCIINAFMYIDGKSFLPMGPVMLLAVGHFLSETRLDRKYTSVSAIILSTMSILNVLFSECNVEFQMILIPILALSFITAALMIWISRNKKERVLPVYAAVSSMMICIANNFSDTFATQGQVKEFYNPETKKAVISTIENDSDMYRFANTVHNEVNVNHIFSMKYLSTSTYSSVSNSSLREFRFNTSLSENRARNTALQNQPYNIIFNTLMGCRYRMSSKKMKMYNEEMIADLGENAIYRNDYAFPLGFASADVMGETVFSALPSQLKAEAILNNIIIPGSSVGDTPHMTEEIFPDMSPLQKDHHIKYENGSYIIDTKTEFTIDIELEQITKNKILIVTASANNKIGGPLRYSDVFLIINGVKNKLTDPRWKYNNHNYNFTYVLSSYDTADNLTMTFSPGLYTISDIRVFTLDASILNKTQRSKDAFIIDRSNSLGDTITGIIDAAKDGWFNISLPYDDGFRISVDGTKTDYFKTNTAFIGFPITAGRHEIEITYEAPLKKTGMAVSLSSVVIMGLFIIFMSIRKRKI